jgi:hypothetical protein
MPAIDNSEALQSAVRHTLEMMCFAEAVATPAPVWSAPAASTESAAVPFRNRFAGRVELRTTTETAQALAAAMLGKPDRTCVPPALAGDTLAELATVICGRFASSLDPYAPLFLGGPEPSPTGPAAGRPSLRHDFLLDAGPLSVLVYLD